MKFLEDLCAALLLAACIAAAAGWWLSHEAADAGAQWVVVSGRE